MLLLEECLFLVDIYNALHTPSVLLQVYAIMKSGHVCINLLFSLNFQEGMHKSYLHLSFLKIFFTTKQSLSV
jgi:hypothetical protein